MPRAWTLVATLFAVAMVAGAFAPAVSASSLAPETRLLVEPVVGASAVHLDGTVYLFGGRLNTGVYSDKVVAIDMAGGPPRVVDTLPEPAGGPTVGGTAGRYSGAAAASGGRIYYFGGATTVEVDLDGDGSKEKVPKASRDILEFDPATGDVRTLVDKLPTGAWGMTAVESNGYIYLFGGFTFDPADLGATKRHDRVLRFQVGVPEGTAQRVRELATMLPYAVQDAAAAKVGNRIFIMGGLSDHDPSANPCPTYTYYNSQTEREETNQVTVCLTKRIISFDPSVGSEFAIGVSGELPYRAQFVSAAVVNNKAYVPGGLLTDGSASTSIVEVSIDERGSPVTKVLVPTLPRGAFGQGVATDGAHILILGGRTGGESQLTDEIHRLDPRVTSPWAPRAASAVDITGGVRLTWEPPTYNGDGTITGYRIYRQPAGGAEERVAEVPGTSVSYDDTGVRPGTQYTWRIVAINTANSANDAGQGSRVTRSSGIAVPGAVAAFEGYAGNGVVLLRWQAPIETGGSNLTGYRILRNDQLLTTVPPDVTEYTDTSVVNGETYQYHVRAYNAKGDGLLSEPVRAVPAPVPPPPGDLRAEVIPAGAEDNAVRLAWNPPPESVTRYVLYRSPLPGRVGEAIAEISSTTYIDNEVERGRTYYYTVIAENAAGRSPPSPESAASLVSQPGAPTDVVALGMEGEVRVSWSAPADTGDAPASSLRYIVYRATGGGQLRHYKTDIESTVFIDRLVTPGQSYTYAVSTLNPMESPQSATATATAKAILNRAPTAILAILPQVTVRGEPVELDASQSSDIDGTIKTYLFDFGDGTDPVTTGLPTVTHQYAANGTFTATVIVTDNRNEVSAPAFAQVIVGETISKQPPSGFPGDQGGSGLVPGGVVEPGSGDPEVPGPGAALVLAAIAAVALAYGRRHSRR